MPPAARSLLLATCGIETNRPLGAIDAAPSDRDRASHNRECPDPDRLNAYRVEKS